MPPYTRLTLPLALLALLSLSACATAYSKPDITLRDVHLARLGLSRGTVEVDLEVTNPNPFALHTEGVHYLIGVREAGAPEDAPFRTLGEGLFEEKFSVAAGTMRPVTIPVEFSYAALGGAGVELFRAKALEYRVVGTVNARTPVGNREVPFERRGLFNPSER